MKTFKKLLFLLAIAVGTHVQVTKATQQELANKTGTGCKYGICKKIGQYLGAATVVCKAFPQTAEEAQTKTGKQAKCLAVVNFARDAQRIADNVETFINDDLKLVSERGNKLLGYADCLDKSSTAACETKCTSENDCLALIFKTTKELLDPVLKDLIASGPTAKTYNNGALFNLVNLSVLPTSIGKPTGTPETLRDKLSKKVAQFANNLEDALNVFNALAVVLSPTAFINASPELKESEKTALEQVPQVVLPSNTEINSTEEADFSEL